MNDNHMTSKETASYIGASINTLRKYVHQERLPVLKFPGRRKWIFRKDLVDEWIKIRSRPEIINDPGKKQNDSNYGKLRILRP